MQLRLAIFASVRDHRWGWLYGRGRAGKASKCGHLLLFPLLGALLHKGLHGDLLRAVERLRLLPRLVEDVHGVESSQSGVLGLQGRICTSSLTPPLGASARLILKCPLALISRVLSDAAQVE